MNDKGQEITAKEFAEIMGKHDTWAQRIARQAHKKGLPFPRKRGNYWFATESEWREILTILDLRLRDRKRKS